MESQFLGTPGRLEILNELCSQRSCELCLLLHPAAALPEELTAELARPVSECTDARLAEKTAVYAAVDSSAEYNALY